jgi:hypothetical protein
VSEEKKHTERDLVMAKREGWVASENAASREECYGFCRHEAEMRAAEAFPLPKVTRPRVVTRGQSQFRVENGVVMARLSNAEGWRESAFHTAEWVRTLADLLANPTEEVPDA